MTKEKILKKRLEYIAQLKARAVSNGQTQAQVGALLNDTSVNVNKVFSGRNSPTLDKLIAYADALDLEIVFKPKK